MKSLRIFPKIILLSVIFFNFSCSFVFKGEDNEWTTINITQNRDMSQYEQGGHFWCRNRPYGNEKDPLNGEKKVRDFIWQHWTEKRRGYIKMSCAEIDTSRTTHYFIEPNESGEWNIARRDISNDLEDNKTITDDFVTVERPKTESGEDWKLILKTKGGKIVGTIPRY